MGTLLGLRNSECAEKRRFSLFGDFRRQDRNLQNLGYFRAGRQGAGSRCRICRKVGFRQVWHRSVEFEALGLDLVAKPVWALLPGGDLDPPQTLSDPCQGLPQPPSIDRF